MTATRTRKTTAEKPDRLAEITESIVDAFEHGEDGEAWSAPWHGVTFIHPENPVSGAKFSGGNHFILSIIGQFKGYSMPALWASYKQFSEKGLQVRKGEKSCLIRVPIVSKKTEVDVNGIEVEKKRVFFKVASVFHIDQTDDIEGKEGSKDKILAKFTNSELSEPERLENAETFLNGAAERLGVEIKWNSTKAAYSPDLDHIIMPGREFFKNAEGMYATLAHELAHSTGHKSRLNRDMGMTTEKYAFEELVAELSAAFVMGHLGLAAQPRDDHKQYVSHWVRQMKGDSGVIWKASTLAEKVLAYLIGETDTEETEED